MSNKRRIAKPVPVVHQMFDPATGILPCCGVSRYEAPPTDQVALEEHHVVTCRGKKRYREDKA